MSSSNPYKITGGRNDNLKPAGVGTKLMAMVFMAAVGAGAGVFLFMYVMGHGRGTRNLAAASPTLEPGAAEAFNAVFWGFLLGGAIMGALSVFAFWPSKDEEEL